MSLRLAPNERVQARIFVESLSDMTKAQRKQLATWMREKADDIEVGGHYDPAYTMRYLTRKDQWPGRPGK